MGHEIRGDRMSPLVFPFTLSWNRTIEGGERAQTRAPPTKEVEINRKREKEAIG